MHGLLLATLLATAQGAPDRGHGMPANCNLPESERPEERPYNNIDDDCNPETRDDDLDRDGLIFDEDCDDTVDEHLRMVEGDLAWPSEPAPCPEGAPPLAVKGDLVVSRDAASVAGLSCVCVVLGDLDLSGNRALTSLEGLEGLTRVGGSISIGDNNVLAEVEPIAQLEQIAGEIQVSNNSEVDGLEVRARMMKVGAETMPDTQSVDAPPLIVGAQEALRDRSWIGRLIERTGGAGLLVVLALSTLPIGLLGWLALRQFGKLLDPPADGETPRRGLGEEHYEQYRFDTDGPADPDLPPQLQGLGPEADLFKRSTTAESVDFGLALGTAGSEDQGAAWLIDAALVCDYAGVELCTLEPGDVMGGIGLIEDSFSTVDTRVVGAGRLAVIERPGYDRLVAAGGPAIPRFDAAILASQSKVLRGLRRRVAAGRRAANRGEPEDAPAVEMRQRLQSWARNLEPRPATRTLALHEIAAFEGIPRPFLEQLAAHGRPTSFSAGKPLFTQGRRGRELYLLLSGEVELLLALAEPFEPIPVDRAGPGDLLGATELFTGTDREYSAVALGPGSALVLDAEAGARLLLLDEPVGHSLRLAWIRAMEAACRRATTVLDRGDPGAGQARWLGPQRTS